MDRSQWVSAIIFIVGFPFLTIILGEIVDRLETRKNLGWAKLLGNIRILVLPSLATWVVVHQFLGYSRESWLLKGIESLIGYSAIVALLNLIGILFVRNSKAKSQPLFIVPRLFVQIARILVILSVGAYMLGSIWQVDLSSIVTALGVGSLVIALALQNTLSNLVSGFLLLFDSPFKVGDWIRFGDIEGQIVDLNWRSVRLKTLDRDLLIVPNSVLDGENIYNYHSGDPLHAERYLVGFSYDDPPNHVKRVLESATAETHRILSQPRPEVRTVSYDDFAITYEVKYFIDDFQYVEEIRNEFRTSIFYAAKRNGLTIPFPIRTIYHVRQSIPRREEYLEQIQNFLQSLPYFVSLEPNTIAKFAEKAAIQVYGIGDRVVREGESDDGLYIIQEGKIRLFVADLHGHQKEVAYLSREDFFGETALLPGEVSLVTGIVTQDLTVLILPSEVIAESIAGSARFAKQMYHFIEERKAQIYLTKGAKSLS
ncbi:mechanosensitive ion channel family protein [Spirulina sp. 06S082]|uniref:mechanosensitive ion channel family protein n=1 Tax=Spirulina sp. 06S082 TaxID=3110248 RepID=UPI002B211DDD|nr:mechanosensitive ion channel family protein [Spirulina sp. 06S082]MEA5471861.1 mechanosensitive ion channel family protein [Spirulina sp. 06S082]